MSSGRYLLFLNPDTELKPDTLVRLLEFMDTHSDAGGAGGRLLNPDGSLQYSCSPAPTLGREFARLFHIPGFRPDGYYQMSEWDITQPKRVDVLLGACMIMRREAFYKVGMFDEKYFMYSEEVDLCLRLRHIGGLLYWVLVAEVIHIGGQSTRQASEEMFLRLYESKVRYFRIHHGNAILALYKFILIGASIFRLLIVPLAWLLRPAGRKTNLAQAENYLRLLANVAGM